MQADATDLHRRFNRLAEEKGWPMRSDPGLAFVAPELKRALAVWREKAGRRRYAARRDMTPSAMKSFLPDLAILDVLRAPKRLRFRARIIGTELSRIFGDSDGAYLDEIVPAPFLERWEALLQLCVALDGPLRSTSVLEFRRQTYLNIEVLFAPLSAPDRSLSAILVVGKTTPRDVHEMAPATPAFAKGL